MFHHLYDVPYAHKRCTSIKRLLWEVGNTFEEIIYVEYSSGDFHVKSTTGLNLDDASAKVRIHLSDLKKQGYCNEI